MPISDKILLQHIEDLLQEYFSHDLRIEKTENQTRLTVGEPGIWIEYNEDFEEEILIGVEHRDCLHLGNQNDLVNTFFNLLTKRIRICRSFKGTFCFYETLDIELSDNRFYKFWSEGVDLNLGTNDDKVGEYAIKSFVAATKALKEDLVFVS